MVGDELTQVRTQLRYRPAEKADLPHIERLRQERWVLLCQSDGRFLQQQPGDIRAWLTHADCDIWVGERGVGNDDTISTLVGYVTAWQHTSPYGDLPAETGLIDELALDAHKYHAGLGRGLVEQVRRELHARQKTILIACVPRHHAVEQAFWRALGAVEWTPASPSSLLSIPPAPPTSIWMSL